MKTTLLFFCVILICFKGFSQSGVSILWDKSFGGTRQDDAYKVLQTSDGGYIMAGTAESTDGDVTGNHGCRDYWVVKTDPNGNLQWKKCYGGSSYDEALSIIQTSDGGFFIAGMNLSIDGDITSEYTGYWLVKTDSVGTIQWQEVLQGYMLTSAEQTSDGGYIVAGDIFSDGTVPGAHGSFDYWVVKVDSEGVIQWQKAYGGSNEDLATSIKQTSDEGYIIAGTSASNDGDVSGNHGLYDYWVVKTDSTGEIQWQKSYGGSDNDGTYVDYQLLNYFISPAARQTSDGGYIIAGSSASNNGDVSGNHGEVDYWVVKTDETGNIQWQKCFGSNFTDYARSIELTSEGGFVVCGYSRVYVDNPNYEQYHIYKITQVGEIEWDKIFDNKYSIANSVCQTSDGNYIVAGSSLGNFRIIKTCFSDPLTIDISDLNYCHSTLLTASDGFTSYLWNTGETTQSISAHYSGVFSVTANNSSGCTSENQIVVPDPVQPFDNEQICMVTLDEQSGKNNIVIEKTLNVATDSILIYRLDDLTSTFIQIGSVGINESGIFIDKEATPAQQSYQYKISVKDTCGNESGLSSLHRTIFLQANSGINKEVNLYWNPYQGFDYPNFEIYRSVGNGDYFLIANVPNNVFAFTDLNPPDDVKKYQVRVTKSTSCAPSQSQFYKASSNVLKLGTNDSIVDPTGLLSVYPNPACDYLAIKKDMSLDAAMYKITDLAGRTLLHGNFVPPDFEINISGLSSGMYVLKISNPMNCRLKFIKK
jgi:hypothetical protein